MFTKYVTGFLGIFLYASIISAREIPEYLQVCHKNDPKISECITSSIEKIKPYLIKGLPEINIPPLEPLYLGDLALVDNSGNRIKITAKDVTVYGAGNFIIKKLTNVDGMKRIRVNLNLPNLKVNGKYNAEGQLLSLPIKGSGRFDANFTNLNSIVKIDTFSEVRDGAARFLVKDIKLNSKLEKGKLKLHDLFGGDKALGEVINEAINTNFDAIAVEFVPIIERELEKKFKNIAEKILLPFTYDQLIPE